MNKRIQNKIFKRAWKKFYTIKDGKYLEFNNLTTLEAKIFRAYVNKFNRICRNIAAAIKVAKENETLS